MGKSFRKFYKAVINEKNETTLNFFLVMWYRISSHQEAHLILIYLQICLRWLYEKSFARALS